MEGKDKVRTGLGRCRPEVGQLRIRLTLNSPEALISHARGCGVAVRGTLDLVRRERSDVRSGRMSS